MCCCNRIGVTYCEGKLCVSCLDGTFSSFTKCQASTDKSGSFMQFTGDNCNVLVGKPITGRFLVQHPLNTQFHPVTASNHLLVGEKKSRFSPVTGGCQGDDDQPLSLA